MASPRSPRKVVALGAPPCRALGSQCRRLKVTLRIGSLEEGRTSLDHEATWLLGHTAQIAFGDIWEGGGDLYVEAVLHVPCRHLQLRSEGATCLAHGYASAPHRAGRIAAQPRRLGGDRFRVVDGMRLVARELRRPAAPPPPATPRALPVIVTDNPCVSAPCRTADNRRGAACCRDLQIEIMCTRRQKALEALVRARRSPYMCKVTRPGDFSIEAEVISACGYLEGDGISCALHGRERVDGRPAKPDLCSDWPPRNKGVHPGCVFRPVRRRTQRE
ncbi:MAG TPA: hypothetical protein VFW66_06370 [Gemmatimonadales bacterium]|nr:hypothetical protein [Gemmatimonadales bacterium]